MLLNKHARTARNCVSSQRRRRLRCAASVRVCCTHVARLRRVHTHSSSGDTFLGDATCHMRHVVRARHRQYRPVHAATSYRHASPPSQQFSGTHNRCYVFYCCPAARRRHAQKPDSQQQKCRTDIRSPLSRRCTAGATQRLFPIDPRCDTRVGVEQIMTFFVAKTLGPHLCKQNT